MSRSSKRVKIIRDPIHEYISVFNDELPLVDSPEFQRLRQVKQNSTAYLTYPSAGVNRFEHALGTKHLADKMLSSALANSEEGVRARFEERVSTEIGVGRERKHAQDALSRVVRVAAMAHDMGHPPFSHVIEEVMDWGVERVLESGDFAQWAALREATTGKLHEFLGALLLQRVPAAQEAAGEDLELVVKTLRTAIGDPSVLGTIHELISFDIDADRCDYLARDGKASGADFGVFDIVRLVESLQLQEIPIEGPARRNRYVIRASIRALSAIESLLLERYKAYRWLYFHPRVVASNAILRELCYRLWSACLDGRSPLDAVGFDLRPGDPISKRPDGLPFALFDDTYIMSAIRVAWAKCGEALRANETGDFTKAELSEVLTLAEELLFRSKRGFSLWKNVKEYQKFDDTLVRDIEDIYYGDQRERYSRRTGVQIPAADLKQMKSETDFALNWLALNCMTSFAERQELQDSLNDELRKKGAFALISANFFKPLEHGVAAGEYTVVGKDGKLYHVTDASELLERLKEARRRDIHVHVYAMWPGQDIAAWPEGERDQQLEMVKKVLAKVLLDWLRRFLEQN